MKGLGLEVPIGACQALVDPSDKRWIWLPKDIGSQFGVPRHQRVCQLCGTGFGDEMHLVFECAAMTDLRGQFPDIFQPHQTMQQFMWQPNLLQVAKFLDAGMKRLQTVDPDEGSNI